MSARLRHVDMRECGRFCRCTSASIGPSDTARPKQVLLARGCTGSPSFSRRDGERPAARALKSHCLAAWGSKSRAYILSVWPDLGYVLHVVRFFLGQCLPEWWVLNQADVQSMCMFRLWAHDIQQRLAARLD